MLAVHDSSTEEQAEVFKYWYIFDPKLPNTETVIVITMV